MNRLLALWVLMIAGAGCAWAEGHGGRLTWVEYDPVTLTNRYSTGGIAPATLTPGQYVRPGRGGESRARGEWRPPQDLLVKFPPTNGLTRVEFSHERHFGALGVKNCKVCHHDLGTGLPLRSWAASPDLEPHGARSRGRFCATCHHANFTANQIIGVQPPGNITLFTALGHRGDPTCNRCHAPADHGADYTGSHGDRAEHGAANQCSTCHRNAGAITAADRAQKGAYRTAQLTLHKNPADTAAFQKVLPNSFCTYCHGNPGRAKDDD